ncbi:MAG: flippase [Melioribacteraceae bacterium]
MFFIEPFLAVQFSCSSQIGHFHLAGKDIKTRIFKNILILSSAEITSRIINFISFAYLARILLVDSFGLINFILALTSFFLLIVNYGTDTIGGKDIAMNEMDISIYVSKLISFRLIIAFIFYFLFAVVLLFISQSSLIKNSFLIYTFTFFSNALLINWVFRGIERTFPISLAQILSALFSLIAFIILVHHSDSVIHVISILTLSSFINSFVLIIYFIKYSHRLKFLFDPIFIKEIMKASTPLAVSALMINIYYNLDQVMLGMISTKHELGYYAAAYKITLLAVVPSSIILQSFFPQLAKFHNQSKERARLMNSYTRLMFTSGIFFTSMGILFAGEIIRIVFGSEYEASVPLLRILTLNVFLVYLNMTYGNPLIAWNKQKHYSYVIAVGAFVNIVLNFILIPKYLAYGAAIATILSEVAVFAGLIYIHWKTTNDLYSKILLRSASAFLTVMIFGRVLQLLGIAWWLVLILSVIIFIVTVHKTNLLSLSILKEFLNEEI